MNKITIGIVVVGVAFFVAGIASNFFLRPLPFQEVVALDHGIAIVNSQKWFIDNLQISLSLDGGEGKKVAFDKNGVCVLSGLVNGHEYLVEICRTDLKGSLLYKKLQRKVTPNDGGEDYYVLVGASVGKSWNLSELPERLNLGKGVVFGNRTVYQFDKGKVVDDLVNLSFPVTSVILKECSAYFPRDLESSNKNVVSWVNQLKQNGIKPVLATTVPVTVGRTNKEPEKQKSLLLFNDFIRQYVKLNNIGLLDLEKALRISDSNRCLRDGYAQDDGTHLVGKVYNDVLDKIILHSFFIGVGSESE